MKENTMLFLNYTVKNQKKIDRQLATLFFFYKNVVFPAHPEYSYFSADFKLKIFLYYS